MKISMVLLLTLGMYFGCCNPMKAQQKPPANQTPKRESMDKARSTEWSSWPSQSAVQTMIAQDGDPAEVSSEGAVWYDQGLYKRIQVMRHARTTPSTPLLIPKCAKNGSKNSWLLTTLL